MSVPKLTWIMSSNLHLPYLRALMSLPAKVTVLESAALPDLPEEIGRIIFEIAASLDTQTATSCALVSKKVKPWAETVLYRHIRIGYSPKRSSLARTIRDPSSTKPPGFFASRVKSLTFITPGSGIGGDSDSLTILRACHGLESLHLWHPINVKFTTGGKFTKFITAPSIALCPRQLIIRGEVFSECVGFKHAILRNLTHLDLEDYMFNLWEWGKQKELNRLTHLSLKFDSVIYDRNVTSDIITQLPNSLKILIFWVPAFVFTVSYGSDESVEVMKSIQDGQLDRRAILGARAYDLKSLPELDPQWNLDRIAALYRRSSDASRFDSSWKDSWIRAEEIVERRRLDLQVTQD